MQGFIILDYAKRFKEAIEKLIGLIGKGEIQVFEDPVFGIDSAPRGLKKLLMGDNVGKIVVYCDKEDFKGK